MIFTTFLWQYQSVKLLYLEKGKEDPIMQSNLKILLKIEKAENLDYLIILIKKLARTTENKYLRINNIFNE
tara:strand:+ start:33369 stop:33581 length:213 start_codon:yes stop_codon:yes gene_type:complete